MQTQSKLSAENVETLAVIKPERNLLAAILSRAICDIYGTACISQVDHRSATTWIRERVDVEKPFSFGWVASHLDLDPADLQDKIYSFRNNSERLRHCMSRLK